MDVFLRCALALSLLATGAMAESYTAHQAKRPDLFDPDTGLRIARIRSPVPNDIPGRIQVVTASEVEALLAGGALALDVLGARNTFIEPMTGEWLISIEHKSLPGAVWIPELGRAVLSDRLSAYMVRTLALVTESDVTRQIVVFCRADCWMSWNAAQRVAALGYERVYWFRNGTDGWLDHGGALFSVTPIPDDPQF